MPSYKKFKKFIRKGDGNTLSFVCIMIGICMCFLYVTAFLQLYLGLNKLSEAASVVSRAIATTSGYAEALNMGKNLAEVALDYDNIDDVNVDVELIDADGNKVKSTAKNWAGGNFAKVTVSADINTLDPYVISGKRSRALIVMLESGSLVVTKEQILKCSSVEEYLDLILPVYKYYCDMYNVPYPGLIALQTIQENSLPHPPIEAKAFYNGNNLAGLKVGAAYRAGIGYLGHQVGDGTGGTYLYFKDCSESVQAIVYTISVGYSQFFNDSPEQFAHNVARKWIGTGSDYGSEVYANYVKYNLAARGY